MLIQCKTRSIEETTEKQQQITDHFISLEKSHTTCHPELIVCFPDELPGNVGVSHSKTNEIVQMSKPSHFMSCSQNISKTLVFSTVVPHNLQHITEDKTTYSTAMKVAVLKPIRQNNHE